MAAHRYWRLHIAGQNGGSFSGALLVLLTEVEMRTSVGGADQCTGGTAIGQPGYASAAAEDPPKAFDNNTGTWWQGYFNNVTDTARPRPCAIGYDFGAGNEKDIVEIGISAHASYLDRTPRNVVVEASDDGTNWAFQWLITCKTWASSAMRSFARPTVQSANRYWMVYSRRYERENYNANYSCAEMKFYEGGVDVTSGGTPIGDVQYSGSNTPTQAFDGNNSTYYASLYTGECWLGYDFGSGVTRDITSVDFRARGDFDGQALQAGQLYYSQDGVNWLPDWPFLSLPQWATGELRTFTEGGLSGKYFWRVRFTSRQGGVSGASPIGVHEVQFRAVAGVAATDTNLVVGLAKASGNYQDSAAYQPGRAFDGVVTGDNAYVGDDTRGGYYHDGHWVGMIFPAGREVAELSMTARTTFEADSPASFVIEYSEDNGFTWTTTDTYSGLTWTSGETKTFAVSGTTPISGRRRQMVVC